MSQESQQDQRTTRRDVLLGVGIAGAGAVVLAGCSTAAVPPYGGMPASAAPAAAGQGVAAPASGQAAAPGQNAGTGGGAATGTLLGMVTDIPVGGGKVFMPH